MHIANFDNLVNIHIVMAADFCQLICKRNVDRTESIFHNLGHFCRANVSHNDFSLAERRIDTLDLLTDCTVICTNRAIVVQQLISHVAGDDTLWCMNKVDIFANFEAIRLNYRAYIFIYRTRRNCGFHHNGCSFGADLHYILDGLNHIARIHFLTKLIIGCRHRNDVCIRHLILGREFYAALYRCRIQFIQTLLLKGRLTCVECCHKFFVVVRANHLDTVRCQHQSCGQTNVPQSNYVNHFQFSSINIFLILFSNSTAIFCRECSSSTYSLA